MVDIQTMCEGTQAASPAYDAVYVMQLVAEKQARQAAAQLTKGEEKNG